MRERSAELNGCERLGGGIHQQGGGGVGDVTLSSDLSSALPISDARDNCGDIFRRARSIPSHVHRSTLLRLKTPHRRDQPDDRRVLPIIARLPKDPHPRSPRTGRRLGTSRCRSGRGGD